MSVLGYLCAFVTGIDAKSADVQAVLERAEEASRCAYAQRMRRRPHADVGEAVDSQPSLAERIRIVKVVDVLKNERAESANAACSTSSFRTSAEAVDALGEGDCVFCQTTDQTNALLMIIKRRKDWIVIESASGPSSPSVARPVRDRPAVQQALASLLKAPNGRVVCTYLTRR